MANKREETISKHRISAAVDRHPSHQPPHTWASELKKYLGSKACDPITILDDGESDATEISYVDLENDDDTFPKRHHSVSNKRIKAGNRCSGMQATVKNPHYSDDNHNTKESKPTKHTEKVIHPLFRVLTEDEVPVPNLQAAPEDCSMGLKAWPKTHGSLAKTAPIMQTKAISQSSSIALFNKERTKNAIRKDRDAPQYDMSVLSSKRKRTIGELGYDELISPAQIESPSEKLVRMARKCRQRPKRCDTSLQCVEGTAKRPAQATKVSRNNEKKSTQSNETTVKRNASGTVPVKRQLTSTYVLNYSETGASTPFSNIRAPLSDSYTSATTVSNLPKTEPIVKSHASLLSLKSEIGQLESPVKHRITAGKGLSQETLKRFQETRDWNCSMEVDQNADEAQNEETQVPNIAYGYFVQKREWLEIEEDAVQSTVGPFHTMDEANTVAKAEVQSPQIDGYEGIQSMGWSYYYEQDENGMQKHMARVLEIHVETIVYRGKCHFSGLLSQT